MEVDSTTVGIRVATIPIIMDHLLCIVLRISMEAKHHRESGSISIQVQTRIVGTLMGKGIMVDLEQVSRISWILLRRTGVPCCFVIWRSLSRNRESITSQWILIPIKVSRNNNNNYRIMQASLIINSVSRVRILGCRIQIIAITTTILRINREILSPTRVVTVAAIIVIIIIRMEELER